MKNLIILVAVLVGSFALALLFGAEAAHAGRIGVAALFFFTGLGHFFQAEGMMQMMPPQIPGRRSIVIGSGFLELALAVGILLPPYARAFGIAICVFLIAVTPLNIWSAIRRVPYGGHGAGPKYLLARLPIQLLFLAWTWWWAVRPIQHPV